MAIQRGAERQKVKRPKGHRGVWGNRNEARSDFENSMAWILWVLALDASIQFSNLRTPRVRFRFLPNFWLLVFPQKVLQTGFSRFFINTLGEYYLENIFLLFKCNVINVKIKYEKKAWALNINSQFLELKNVFSVNLKSYVLFAKTLCYRSFYLITDKL